MKKRILSLCMAIALLLAMMPQIVLYADAAEMIAEGTCGDNLTWILDDEGKLTISGTGKMTSYAFEDSPWNVYAAKIKTVVLGSGVTNISTSAFSNCTNLSKIEMPETLEEIRDTAFYNCTSLISFTIPKGVESIGGGAFLSCTNLSEISVSEGNTSFCIDDFGVLYTVDKSVILWTPSSLSKEYEIPNTVVEIEQYAFENCTNITSIVIPSSITDIGMGAFTNCTNLSSVYFMGDYPYLGSSFIFINAKATAYYPSDNETWNGDMINIVGISEWVAYEYPNYDGFWLGRDGWSFANAPESFAEEPTSHADDYYIPRERYDALYGKAYVDAQDGLFTTEWGGNCAGMSTTAILFFLDKLDWEIIDAAYIEDFKNPNDFYRTVNHDLRYQSYYPAIGNDTEVTRLIEAYQLYINAINRSRLVENLENTYFSAEPEIGTFQGVTAENEPIVTTNYTYRHIPVCEGGTYIASMLEVFQEAYDNNIPLYISLKADHFGHGIVSRTDLKPEDMGDGWWRIYVYDPNKPYINESVASTDSIVETDPKYKYGCNELIDNGGEIYLELNPALNQWRYCTSVNSNSSDSYIGSTESGELLWNGVYAENENNEQYHVMRPDFFYTIDLTDFTMEDYANPHFDSTNAWIPENELAVAVDGNTVCSIYTSTGELAAVVEDGDAFVLTAAGGFSSYIGESEDGGSSGGRIYLPNDVYTVYYTSGAVQFLGSDNVLSFSCDGAAVLTVDITLNSLQIIAQEDGIAAVKCANVTSTDECSYVDTDGALTAGETFSIAYSDDNKVTASTDSKDGEFQLYQKDANQEEAVATKVIKSSNLWWLWIVGGVAVAGVVLFIIMKKKKPNA